jgi:hypothetical protein
MPEKERDRLRADELDVMTLFDERFFQHLERQLLQAVGLKPRLAAQVWRESPAQSVELRTVLQALMSLRNEGPVNADKEPVEGISAVDVFNVLRNYPEAYFQLRPEQRAARVHELLAPSFKGSPARRAELEREVDHLVRRFVDLHDRLMKHAQSLAGRYYDSAEAFPAAVARRARFENEPIPAFVRTSYRRSFQDMIDYYQLSGDAGVFRQVDKMAAASMRNAVGLQRDGSVGKRDDGGFELQRQTIDGITYALHAWDDPAQSRRLSVSLPMERTAAGGAVLPSLAERPELTAEQLRGLRYKFTTDGWASYRELPVFAPSDGSGRLEVHHVDGSQGIPVAPSELGRLEGLFISTEDARFALKDYEANYQGYTFAVPDRHDLRERLAASGLRA